MQSVTKIFEDQGVLAVPIDSPEGLKQTKANLGRSIDAICSGNITAEYAKNTFALGATAGKLVNAKGDKKARGLYMTLPFKFSNFDGVDGIEAGVQKVVGDATDNGVELAVICVHAASRKGLGVALLMHALMQTPDATFFVAALPVEAKSEAATTLFQSIFEHSFVSSVDDQETTIYVGKSANVLAAVAEKVNAAVGAVGGALEDPVPSESAAPISPEQVPADESNSSSPAAAPVTQAEPAARPEECGKALEAANALAQKVAAIDSQFAAYGTTAAEAGTVIQNQMSEIQNLRDQLSGKGVEADQQAELVRQQLNECRVALAALEAEKAQSEATLKSLGDERSVNDSNVAALQNTIAGILALVKEHDDALLKAVEYREQLGAVDVPVGSDASVVEKLQAQLQQHSAKHAKALTILKMKLQAAERSLEECVANKDAIDERASLAVDTCADQSKEIEQWKEKETVLLEKLNTCERGQRAQLDLYKQHCLEETDLLVKLDTQLTAVAETFSAQISALQAIIESTTSVSAAQVAPSSVPAAEGAPSSVPAVADQQ